MTTQHDERAELIAELRGLAQDCEVAGALSKAKVLRKAAAILAADSRAGGEVVKVTDEIAYSFHRALTDAPLSSDEVKEIKTGLRAALANYTAPQPQAVAKGWQPIETAPKDGTVILVTDTFTYRSDPEKKPHHVYRAVRWNEECYSWEIYNDGEMIDQDGPTFWMPLPAEPGATLSASPAAPAEREPLTDLIDVMDTGQQSLQLVFKSRAAADKAKDIMLHHISKPARTCGACGKAGCVAGECSTVGINGLTEAETAASASVYGLTPKDAS